VGFRFYIRWVFLGFRHKPDRSELRLMRTSQFVMFSLQSKSCVSSETSNAAVIRQRRARPLVVIKGRDYGLSLATVIGDYRQELSSGILGKMRTQMDLSRLNLPPLYRVSQWVDRFRGFRDHLAHILEGESGPLLGQQTVSDLDMRFEVRSDFEALMDSTLERRHMTARMSSQRRAELVFDELAPYFDAGFCLSLGRDGEYAFNSMFLLGRCFRADGLNAPHLLFKAPEMPVGSVLKGRVDPVLRAFDLGMIRSLNDGAAFAFRPVDEILFIIICTRPHLWQVDAIADANKAIRLLCEKKSVSNESPSSDRISTKLRAIFDRGANA
jgi:hypothetical protein